MNALQNLKARFPKLFPAILTAALLSTVGGAAAAYESLTGDCCAPGAPCCHPGSPCCAKHKADHP